MYDLISRKALLEKLDKWINPCVNCESEFPSGIATATVDAAPVVHGEWKEWWPGSCALIMTGEEVLYRCTRCDAKYADTSNFCPNCGAKMDGGNDNGNDRTNLFYR